MANITFAADFTGAVTPFPHFWEHTVGSGHATLALRADWQQQLSRCRRELGFRHVRFHGILSDDMGTLVDEDDQYVYSFFNTDQIFDFLRSIDMRPFVELSFMPLTLSSGADIVFHYKGNITPPRNYDDWKTFIHQLVQHWVNRYGPDEVNQWFFEVWNEPNLKNFWTGSQSDYFRLYQYTADAIKNVHPDLKVGGPATADNAWITEFILFGQENKVPIDFISTHHYPTDAFGKPGDDTVAQLAASHRSVLREEVAATKAKAGDKPVYYTEWCTSSNPFDALHDQPYAAAFITKTVMEAQGYVEGYSYWIFSDIFEENYFCSIPFHGGFGLLNIYGIPKPAYRAYQLLHALGEQRVAVQGSHETVDVWVIKKTGALQVLVTNSALPTHPVNSEQIALRLLNLPVVQTAYMEKIDDTHANATGAWVSMGRPESLSPAQVLQLEDISSLLKEPVKILIDNNVSIITIDVPPQAVVCITLEIA
jgi:xylan 1,4-beta-xylosidase